MRIVTPYAPCRPARRRGASAVEMVLTLTLITTLALGTVDFGRFLYTYIAVSNAARAGAFVGAMNPYTSSTYTIWQNKVKLAASDEMGSIGGFTMGNVTAEAVTETGSLWRARCTVPCTFTTIVNWPLIPNSVTLQRKVELRAIR